MALHYSGVKVEATAANCGGRITKSQLCSPVVSDLCLAMLVPGLTRAAGGFSSVVRRAAFFIARRIDGLHRATIYVVEEATG